MGGIAVRGKATEVASMPRYALPVVFFGAHFLYVLVVVESSLIYHSLGRTLHYPAFRTSWSFFSESVGTCGGPVEYAAALASHLFHADWAGAMFYTGAGVLLWFCARRILRISPIRHAAFLPYLPPVALLVLCTGYQHQPLIVLSMTLGVLSFVGYVKLASRTPRRGAFLMMVLMTCGLFYLSVNGCILFWFMVFLYELLFTRRYLLAGTTAILGTAACLAAWFSLHIDMYPLHWQLNRVVFGAESIKPDTYPRAVLYGLYAYFPLLLLLGRLFAGTPVGSGGSLDTQRQPPGGADAPRRWYSLAAQFLLWSILCVALLWPVVDADKKRSLKIRTFAQKRQWPQLLDYARTNPFAGPMEILDVHDIMMALYHSGSLAEDMLDWPVELRTLTLPEDIPGIYCDLLLRRSDLVLEMGSMALSEKFAYEALVNFGEQAGCLENLAIINMVKGDLRTARVFLNALEKDINHSDRGRYWLDVLADDPTLSKHARINHLRSLVPDADDAYRSSLSLNYEQLLDKNPENKAARDLMMCQLLLSGRLDVFAANLYRYEAFDAGTLPKCYDQALALFRATGGKAPSTWAPSATSEEQARKFLEQVDRYRGDKRQLFRSTRQEFGDSYYFYFYVYREGA